jgi:hypothetical protein
MFRISNELKEEIKRRSEENDCTMTSYFEYLISQDIKDNPRSEKILIGTPSTDKRKKFILKRKLN